LNYPNYTDTTVRASDAFRLTDASGTQRSYGVSRIYSFATQRYEFVGSSGMTSDIAIVQLSTAVPANIATPASLSSALPLFNQQATVFGYGCTDRNNTGTTGGFKQFFTFLYGNNTQTLCPGDSGGPALFGTSGAGGAVWGVNSDYTGAGTFPTWNDIFAHVPYYKDKIHLLMRQWEGSSREVGFDRPGLDYRYINLASADPGLCEDACKRDSACRAYSYVLPGIQSTQARCWLKSGIPDWVPNPNVVSGIPTSQELFFDRGGQDFGVVNLGAARPELCMAECSRDEACLAYTYVAPGVQGPSARCWLKGGVPSPTSNISTVSGVRRGLEVGVNRPGQDYANLALSSANPNLCRNACSTDADCKAFTYVAPGVQGPSARCWLKSGAASPSFHGSTTSGVKRGLEIDSDRAGSDYRWFETADPRPEVCQAQCAAESACLAFTFVPAGRQGTNARCWLKNGIPTKSVNVGVVSGIKGAEFF
jgi:hypothetical protein